MERTRQSRYAGRSSSWTEHRAAHFPDVKIERFHYHAKSGVLSQQITTCMHRTTHTDAPAT